MRKGKLLPTSPSALADFEGCPKRYHAVRLAKTHKQEEGEHLTHGNRVHELLERYVKYKEPLPEHLQHVVPVLEELTNQRFTLFAELEFCVSREFEALEYWDKTGRGWLRGKIDLVAIAEDNQTAFVIDYKTGKRKTDPTQLQIYGAVLYRVFGFGEVHSAFMWLESKLHDVFKVDKGNVDSICDDLTRRIGNMEKADAAEIWNAYPTPLCGWCPVLECEEGKPYRARRKK